MDTMKLRLHGWPSDYLVYPVSLEVGEYAQPIGRVFKNPTLPGYWCAYDMKGQCHGDRYNSAWDAARQLRLGLKDHWTD